MAICPVCKKKFATKSDLASHVAAKHPDRVRHYYPGKSQGSGSKPSSTRAIGPGQGVSGWIAMEEYLGKAQAGKTTLLSICPGKSGMPRLDNYAILYDQYSIEKWNVRFTPRVGTTVSGMYIAGIVYSHLDSPEGVSEVAALSPKVHHAVWQGGNLAASPGRLMKQKWMYVYNASGAAEDMIAGKVAIVVDGSQAEVDVWVDYAVKFNGPTNSQKSSEHKLIHDGKSWSLDGKQISSLPSGLTDGYTIDVESSTEVSSYFDKFFTAFKQLDSLVQGTVYYWHVLADSFTAGYVLPSLGVPLVMHIARRPFPALLPTGARFGLSGGASQSAGPNRGVAAAALPAQDGLQSSNDSVKSDAGSLSESFERLD